ncbi:MAG: PD-(D/E)XK nuclease family protein [Meiothermus sp.]|nr:PD-(D/E)XK nuclease family protein [Meiothermus sp.]
MQQTPLFDLEAANATKVPELIWSKSRREAFEQCLRRYYYTYYGSHSRHALGDPDKPTLRQLKGITGLVLRAGELLHLALRRTLESRRDGRPVSLDSTLTWVRERYLSDVAAATASARLEPVKGSSAIEDSPDGDEDDSPADENGTNAGPRFVEFVYGHPDAAAKANTQLERLERSLTAFFTDPRFARYLQAVGPDSLIEARMRIDLQGASLSGKLDFAFWDGDQFNLADWKIGSVGGAEEDLQLLVYAYLAAEKLGLEPTQIRASRVHLSEGVVVEQAVDLQQLRRARARVQQDLERMDALHRYGLRSQAEVFTPRAEPKICASCAFQKICPQQ